MAAYRSAGCAQSNEEAMREAIKLLRAEGIDFYRPDEWTLKFDEWNYWPRTQRLHRDGDKASRRNQGLSELKALIESLRMPTRPRTTTKPPQEKPTTAMPMSLRLIDE